MKNFLFNRWTWLFAGVLLVLLGPVTSAVVTAAGEATTGLLAVSSELAVMSPDDMKKRKYAFSAPAQAGIANVSDFEPRAVSVANGRASFTLSAIDGSGRYPVLSLATAGADGKFLPSKRFKPDQYQHGTRLGIERVELAFDHLPGTTNVWVGAGIEAYPE